MAKAEIIFFGTLAFLFGIFCFGQGIALSVTLLIAAGAAVFLIAYKQSGWCTVVLIGAFLGMWYGSFRIAYDLERIGIGFDKAETFVVTVRSDPVATDDGMTSFIASFQEPRSGRIRVITRGDFSYGQILAITGTVKEPERSFEFPVSAFPRAIHATGEYAGHPFRTALLASKHRVLDVFGEYIAGDKTAFLGGITLGSRSGFSKEFKDAMRKSGTTHLVALSGYNIAILVSLIYGLLLPMLPRTMTFIATLFIMTLFVGTVGGEPSIIRAALMGFLVLAARHIGRFYSFGHAVVLTAGLMTIVDPRMLFSLGFQLSFVSLLGIAYLAPMFEESLAVITKKKAGAMTKVILDSVSAQVAVLPLLWYSLGSASLISFVPNALILPFIPFTMFLGFCIALAGLIYLPIALPLSLFTQVFLSYETGIIRLFGEFSKVSLPPVHMVIPAIYYGVMIVAVWWWDGRHAGYTKKR